MTAPAPKIVLASASPTRLALLSAAGVMAEVRPAQIDETAAKAGFKAEGATVEATAEALAELKAQRAVDPHSEMLVIGVDQMLDCDGDWLDKPADMNAARENLRRLRGRCHRLVSSVVVLRGGDRLWHHTDSATLCMRRFSDGFLETYLRAAGDDILGSVGGYQLEGLGAQLFTRVEGDYFTILGLPLLPLLDFLRGHGAVPT